MSSAVLLVAFVMGLQGPGSPVRSRSVVPVPAELVRERARRALTPETHEPGPVASPPAAGTVRDFGTRLVARTTPLRDAVRAWARSQPDVWKRSVRVVRFEAGRISASADGHEGLLAAGMGLALLLVGSGVAVRRRALRATDDRSARDAALDGALAMVKAGLAAEAAAESSRMSQDALLLLARLQGAALTPAPVSNAAPPTVCPRDSSGDARLARREALQMEARGLRDGRLTYGRQP